MKKEYGYIALMTLAGVVLGLEIVLILGSIAIPDVADSLLTAAEVANFAELKRMFGWFKEGTQYALFAILILLLIIAFVRSLLLLNPHIRRTFRQGPGRWKLVVMLIVCLALFFPLLRASGYILNFNGAKVSLPEEIVWFAIFTAAGGLIWLICGEMGWGGDFSSWRMGTADKKPRPWTCLLLGCSFGIASYCLLYLNAWALETFMVLVAEVLGRSSEPSALGYRYMLLELAFTFGVSMGIIGALVPALAPTFPEPGERLRRFRPAPLLALVLITAVAGFYTYAVAKYDLGKKSFAAAVGVPEKATRKMTVVFFTPHAKGGATLEEWPLEATSFGSFKNGSMAVSAENLKKVEEYLALHPQGSIYNHVAKDMLINGRYALWEPNKGRELQFRMRKEMILPRLQLLAALRSAPVASENLEYLRSFTDDKNWHVGKRSVVRLSEAFLHFGLIDEANQWFAKAQKLKAEIPGDLPKALAAPVMKSGAVSGRVLVNGAPLAHGKVALVKYSKSMDKLSASSLTSTLADVWEIGADGRFAFDRMGRGEYLLAIMTEKETIPFDLPAGRFTVKAPPAVIRLDAERSKWELGDIDVLAR